MLGNFLRMLKARRQEKRGLGALCWGLRSPGHLLEMPHIDQAAKPIMKPNDVFP